MPSHRKLGRRPDVRLSMLKGQVTTLLTTGQVETTVARAKEVKKIAERLIRLAVKEKDNFTTKEVLVSAPKLDAKGKKLLKTKTSKSGVSYDVVERELKTKTVQVDEPSRLAVRRELLRWLPRSEDKKTGAKTAPVNFVFSELAPRYSERNGGYTRLVRIGQRRGDGAEMVLLQLV